MVDNLVKFATDEHNHNIRWDGKANAPQHEILIVKRDKLSASVQSGVYSFIAYVPVLLSV